MLSRLPKALTLAALAAPMAFGAATPATGSPAVAAVAGQGTVLPGIPTTGCAFQTDIVFTAILAVGAGSGHAGQYPFTFTGASTSCESIAAGTGTGNLTGSVTGSVSYSRTVGGLTITGSVVVDGHGHSVTAECELVLTSVNPVKSYVLTCEAALT